MRHMGHYAKGSSHYGPPTGFIVRSGTAQVVCEKLQERFPHLLFVPSHSDARFIWAYNAKPEPMRGDVIRDIENAIGDIIGGKV